MFGFKPAAPALQAYGKLPIAKDYQRVGASEGAARTLRDWLDQTFSGAAAGAELAAPLRFAFAPEREEPLLGTLWPSADSGGLRKFPFALFIERRRRALVEAASHGFASEAPAFAAFDAWYAARSNYGDGQALLAALRGRTLEVKEPQGSAEAVEPASVPWREWLGALWPQNGDTELQATLQTIAKLAPAVPTSVALRLPLVVDLPFADQIGAWLEALRGLRWLQGEGVPNCFFPANAEEATRFGALVVFRGAPQPRDAAWLAAPGDAPTLPGDFARPLPSRVGGVVPLGGPSLVDSMRGALAGRFSSRDS